MYNVIDIDCICVYILVYILTPCDNIHIYTNVYCTQHLEKYLFIHQYVHTHLDLSHYQLTYIKNKRTPSADRLGSNRLQINMMNMLNQILKTYEGDHILLPRYVYIIIISIFYCNTYMYISHIHTYTCVAQGPRQKR